MAKHQLPDTRPRPILARGELLSEDIDRVGRGAPPWHPRTNEEAAAILRPQAERVVSEITALSANLRGPHVVVEAKVLPNYLAGSHYPEELLRAVNLYSVGTRQSRGTYRTKKQTRENEPTKTYLLAGPDVSVRALANLINAGPSDATRGPWERIRELDTLSLPSPDIVLRGNHADAGDGELVTWEAVLNPIGIFDHDRAVKYLRREGVLSVSPLETVEVPSAGPARDRHFTHEQTLNVLERITDGETRAYFTLALGSGMERSALAAVTLGDINARTHIIRARGTKNTHRDRYVVVSPWAWPAVAEQMKGKVGLSTKLFSLDYKRALDAFYEAQIAAGYAEPLKDAEGQPLSVTEARKAKGVSFEDRFHTLHDCRHTYAVVRLTGQDGEPRADLQAIADQLGHADLQMVSRIYARHRSAIQKAAEAAFLGKSATTGATVPKNQPQIGLA